MPAELRGGIFKTRDGYGIRWREDGKRPQRSGFRDEDRGPRAGSTPTSKPRLGRGAPDPGDHVRRVLRPVPRPPRRHRRGAHQRDDRGAARPRARARSAPGRCASWRAPPATSRAGGPALTPTVALPAHRGRCGRRSAPPSAGATSPATRPSTPAATRSPAPRSCCRSRAEEVDALAVELGPVYGPLVVFAAETGLRTNEWAALERRDIDRAGRAVIVQRRYADGVLTPVPEDGASAAACRSPGGRSTRSTRCRRGSTRRCCSPPRRAATSGSTPGAPASGIRRSTRPGIARRGPYHLRHTFATEALAAGVSIFELARVMGTSVKMIDRTYGHLARDSEEAIRARLDARGIRLPSGRRCRA